MKKKSTGETVRRAVIGIVLADVISGMIYLFLNAILRAIFYGDKYGDLNFTPDYTPILICLFFFFQIAFWISYTRRTSADFKVIREDSFSWKEDLQETVRSEGRVLMMYFSMSPPSASSRIFSAAAQKASKDAEGCGSR